SHPVSLFFQLSAHLRSLHSFPTRRSSDLCAPSASPQPDQTMTGATLLHPLRGSAPECAPRRDFPGCARPVSPGNFSTVKNHAFRDRKSTRLNSSHVKISYAVFCLKKKKKT